MASEERIERMLIDKLGGGGMCVAAILLVLPAKPQWADGLDHLGRAVVLIGRHQLGESPEAHEVVELILQNLRGGGCPEMVWPIAFAPKASEAIAAAVDGPAEELLLHGPRGTGKTHALGVAAVINAELHRRAGFPGPFRVLWLHDTLLSASVKTGRSLELPMWGGLWTLKDDRRVAVFSLAGHELLLGDFVGCQDASSAERLRMAAHMILAEELIASLTDGTGITEQQYDIARSSMLRLETRRRVTMSATNPGAPETWPAVRFFTRSQSSTRLAIQIPREDRLTPEEQAELERVFAHNPTLQRRLAKGDWVMAELGAAIAEGFDEHRHVSSYPLHPQAHYLCAIGWDGGHSPSAVMGQNLGGQIQVFTALNDLHVGVLELIERQVLPWLQTHALWALAQYGASLVHIIDPNMATPGQATITESAERIIVDKLGGTIIKGPVRWPPRREAVLRVLAPRHEGGRPPLQIAPGPDTDLLVQALSGRWFYPTTPGGQTDRSGPKKPNSPFADVGDAFAYLCGWLLGGESMTVAPQEVKVETDFCIGGPGVGRW